MPGQRDRKPHPLSDGDMAIMDDLGGHKGQAVRQLVREAGTELFSLPRYSGCARA